MKSKKVPTKRPRRQLTAADVGRYLKQLATIHRDRLTGNPALGEALANLATILIDAKMTSVEVAAHKFVEQGGFDFDDNIDFGDLTIESVQKALNDQLLTRAHLVILGAERFGIARSRLERLPREEIINVITAALNHEESLNIISNEAHRGGEGRSS